MLKLVLDTNIIISAFFWEGNEAELIRKIEENKIKLFINKEILNEIESVLKRPKFKILLDKTNQTPEHILAKIISLSYLVIAPKLKKIILKDDPSDDKFIECAINAKAGYIVSGDKHLLKLRKYKGIRIVKTSEIIDKVSLE